MMRIQGTGRGAGAPGQAEAGGYELRLYVAGQTPRSMAALNNLKRLCEEHMPGDYSVEVVDLMENPRLAKDDQIVAIPTLVRKLPEPVRKIIGDLSNTERALVALQLRARGAGPQGGSTHDAGQPRGNGG